MIQLKYLRENTEKIKKSSLAKKCNIDFDEILQLDDSRRKIIVKVEKFKADRNIINNQISSFKKNKKDT